MNTIIFQTIRTAAIFGILFFFSVDTAFAAPALAPVSVREITSTSAIITGYVSNPYKNSTVWFDLYDSNGMTTSVATQGIWHGGKYEWNMEGLTPGTKYSYRSAAMEGGETVYSPISSFTTPQIKTTTPSVVYQSQPTVYVKQTEIVKQSTQIVEKKQVVTAPKVVDEGFDNRKTTSQPKASTEGFTNNNAAEVLGASGEIFPTTLIGWILLIIAILVMVLMISVITEPRKEHKEEEDKHKEEIE